MRIAAGAGAFSLGGENAELQITVNFDAKTLKLLLKKKTKQKKKTEDEE